MTASETGPLLTPEDRGRLREIAASVARAARVLRRQRRTHVARVDLEALGMLAVWRKLPSFDPERAVFERWAFYQALRAMIDASREDRKETLFEAALRRGVHGYVAQDDRPAESDFHNDTPETDLRRLQAQTRRMGASAWLQADVERAGDGAEAERSMAAAEAVRAVHEEVGRLSDEQRAHLALRFWDEAEVEEVAARLGLSVRTLHRRWVETRDLLVARLHGRGIFGIPEGFGEAADALALAKKARR